MTEIESSAPAASGTRKSASTAASGSEQERERRAIPDDDSRMQIEDKPDVDNEERAEPPGTPSTSIRRRSQNPELSPHKK